MRNETTKIFSPLGSKPFASPHANENKIINAPQQRQLTAGRPCQMTLRGNTADV
jgi:hypothetical protein